MADDRMKESDVVSLLHRDHKGFRNKEVEYRQVDNPNYNREDDPRQTIRVKVTTYYGNDGYSVELVDDFKTSSPPDRIPGVADSEPSYPVNSQGFPSDKPKSDTRTPEKKAEDSEIERERQWNQTGQGTTSTGIPSGLYESHAERRAREKIEADEARKDEKERQDKLDAARRDRQVDEQLAIANRQADRADRTEDRAISQQAETNSLTRDRYQFDREKYEDERRKPQFMGSPTDTTRNIAYFNPTTGTVDTAPNPMYDEAKVEAQRLKDQLSIGIQLNEITAKQASEQYSRWFKENIEVPYLQSAEARAQASDKRQALDAEERRRQFAAQNSLQRGELGQRAAATAIGAEMDMMPYRVGPTFDKEMGAAINSLGTGGKLDANASAGINFSPGAFSFDKPDLGRIARDATKNALKNVSSYSPADGDYETASYEGINLPNAGTFAGAPQAGGGIDLTGAYNQFIGQYGGPPQT
jgi:hypothetical protein